MALALKLAQGDLLAQCRGQQPVWLIDDVFGELDVPRRNALMKALPSTAQKWITTTHVDWWEESGGFAEMAKLTVCEGTVSA